MTGLPLGTTSLVLKTPSPSLLRKPGAKRGGVVVVPPLKENVEDRLGKPVALSTIYRILAHNGWRKLAPDTAHSQGDASAREGWGKTPGAAGPNRSDLEQPSAAAADGPERSPVLTY